MTREPIGGRPSRVSAGDLAVAGVRLGEPRYDGDDLYWTEGRPAEQGRVALLRERDGVVAEAAPGLSVRSRVHEYGGGAWDARDGVVVVSSDPSGQLLRLDDGPPRPLTPAGRRWRFADLRVLPRLGLVLAVRESHEAPGEPVNALVALRLEGGNDDGGTVLASGADFYACPELSATDRLAWMEWRHPHMPWDSCTIRVGRLRPVETHPLVEPVETRPLVELVETRTVAGGPGESAVHPSWRGEELLFSSDRTGFWELYADTGGTTRQLTRLAADLVEPFWVFGRRPIALTATGELVLRPRIDGCSRPLLLGHGGARPLAGDVVDCDSLDAAGDRIVLLAQFADRPPAIVEIAGGRRRTVRVSATVPLAAEQVSRAEPVTWEGPAGMVHGWFYAPRSVESGSVESVDTPAERSADGVSTSSTIQIRAERSSRGVSTRSTTETGRPPLIVLSHGGPTAFASSAFDLGVQFWTTRGFAVLHVNYSGSSGYGRAYRDRLRGRWGVLDVADCVAGARAMADRGGADDGRLVIRGGSAGGYTTLRALTTSTVFAAGCSRYGIADLTALAADTHKFEAHYLDGLVGPWPDAEQVYRERSPINHVDALRCPLLLLQGADDPVVPLAQAEAMAAAVTAKGLEAQLIVFEGEGHGFRRAETVTRAITAELAFYRRVLRLPAGRSAG